jgi:hypothetical protein
MKTDGRGRKAEEYTSFINEAKDIVSPGCRFPEEFAVKRADTERAT